jgi:hypothetical protein
MYAPKIINFFGGSNMSIHLSKPGRQGLAAADSIRQTSPLKEGISNGGA